MPSTFSRSLELTTQAWPSYFTSMSGRSGQARSSSERLTRRPSATEWGEAPNAMSVAASLAPANARTISQIWALLRASMTLRPALNVAKLARCSCVSTKLGHSARSPSRSSGSPAKRPGSSLPT